MNVGEELKKKNNHELNSKLQQLTEALKLKQGPARSLDVVHLEAFQLDGSAGQQVPPGSTGSAGAGAEGSAG